MKNTKIVLTLSLLMMALACLGHTAYAQGNVAVEGTVATPDDPQNLARFGYSPKEIVGLYRSWRRNEKITEARRWTEEKKYAEAIAQLKAVLQEDKDKPEAWLGLAEAYSASDDAKQAIETYRFLLDKESHPGWAYLIDGDPRCMEQFVIVLHQNKQYAEAWAWHQRALQIMINQKHPDTDLLMALPLNAQTASTSQLPFIAHLVLSVYQRNAPREQSPVGEIKAVYAARQAVSLRPNQAIGHLYLGYALKKQAGTLRTLHRVSKIKPGEYREYAGESTVEQCGQLESEAQNEFKTASETGSKSIIEAAQKAQKQ